MAYRDDLEAALRRAEAAERSLAAVCSIHPNVPSATACASCGRGLCEPCTMPALEGSFCPPCYARAHARRRRRQALLLVGSGAGILGAVIGLVLAIGRPEPPAPAAAPPRDLHAWKTRRPLAGLAKDPCNRALAYELALTYNEDADFDKTVAFVAGFGARCGVWPRLLWPQLDAYEQRGAFGAAVQVATALIQHDPHESDYWWWRGKSFAELGLLDQAAADFRQSMARRMNDEAAARFAQVVERQGRPCEGAFALRRYVDLHADEELEWATRREAQLYLAGACQVLDGQGEVTIRRRPGQPVLETEARAGAASGRFAVDLATGLAVVSRAFAARAGLAARPGAPPITVDVAGQLRPAALALADLQVGAARAPAVHVAIVDALPAGVDGILGGSFLQRFLVVEDARTLTLKGP